MNHPPPAPPAIFGVSDPRFTSSYPAEQMKGLGQAGVWVDYCKALSERDGMKANPPARMPVAMPASLSESVLLTLTGSPSCFPLTPQARQAYADYAAALVKANPNIRELQVWNEPEGRFNAQQYVPLLAATYDAIKGGKDADAAVLPAGAQGVQTSRDSAASPGRLAIRTLGQVDPLILGPGAHPDEVVPPYRADLHMSVEDFAREVVAYSRSTARKGPMLDGYAYHPYWNWAPKITYKLAILLDRVWRGTAQPSPHSGLRFWWTETGAWSSGPKWGRPAMMLGLEGQAQRVYRVAHEAKCNPLVGGMFNYLLRDEEPTHAWTWQSGLYTVTGQPKPALWAFRAGQASRCGKARAVKR